MVFSATVVVWRGFYRECVRESFDSLDQAYLWLYEQRKVYGGALVSGYVV